MNVLNMIWCAALTVLLFCQYWDARVRYDEGAPHLPFARSVRVGGWVLLSGQLGVEADPDGNVRVVSGGLEAEAKAAFRSMEASLRNQGLSKQNIVKCTIMLKDMKDWGTFNKIYLDWLDGHKPTRSAFGVSALALDASMEIECLAHR